MVQVHSLISRDDVENALDAIGAEYNDINDTYSGRGMFGDRCLSFTLTGKRIQRRLCQFFAQLGADMAEDEHYEIPLNLAGDVCTDDLGLDMIVYFPGWKLAD